MPPGKPWHHVGHRVLGNPFTPMGEAYCTRCKEWGASESEAAYEGTVYGMKEWCRRCGAIINFAVWDQGRDPKTQAKAAAWAQEPGADRSGGLIVLPGKES